MKIVDYCESNKQMGQVLCFEDQYEAVQTLRKNCQLPGKPWQTQVEFKMLVKERKVKNACG